MSTAARGGRRWTGRGVLIRVTAPAALLGLLLLAACAVNAWHVKH